jgi:hypothetical protein
MRILNAGDETAYVEILVFARPEIGVAVTYASSDVPIVVQHTRTIVERNK